MNSFKPPVLSPKQSERRRKIQVNGRTRFIVYRGILGWGGTTFILTTLWGWHAKFGWHFPAAKPDVFVDISFGLLGYAIGGYIWGAFQWRRMFGPPAEK